MEVFEKRQAWKETFRQGWLAHLESSGEVDWKRYEYVTNSAAPRGPTLDLASSRLLFVTTSGAFLDGKQQAFAAKDLRGDYTLRTFESSTPLDALGFAHDHFDHQYVNRDPQVAVPLRHLEALVANGRVGGVAETVISFSGYMPDATQVVDEVIAKILDSAQRQRVDGALLVPV